MRCGRRGVGVGGAKGVEVHVRRVAPPGNPVEIRMRGYRLSLRKADADRIEVG